MSGCKLIQKSTEGRVWRVDVAEMGTGYARITQEERSREIAQLHCIGGHQACHSHIFIALSHRSDGATTCTGIVLFIFSCVFLQRNGTTQQVL